jgi:hypothetical protein
MWRPFKGVQRVEGQHVSYCRGIENRTTEKMLLVDATSNKARESIH